MPIPSFRAGHPSEVDGLWRKRLLFIAVGPLELVVFGQTYTCTALTIGLGTPLLAKQWTAMSVLRRLIFDGNTPEFIDADLMGRGAAKFQSFEDALTAQRHVHRKHEAYKQLPQRRGDQAVS